MKWLLLLTILLCPVLAGCSKDAPNGDLQFAQNAFPALAKGDANAESMIDFDNLRMAGMDVGKIYAGMPNETEKSAFRRSFITGFSSSFQGTGASADSFKNWRVQSADAAKTIVAVDGPKGGITLTVSHRDNQQRISGLELVPKSP